MGVTGKYDFPGFKKAGAAAIKAALAATSWGAWAAVGIPGLIISFGAELLSNFLANRGLVIFNLGEIFVSGHLDQDRLDSAMEAGLEKVRKAMGKKLPPEEAEAIDNAVIKAARKALRITRHN